MTARAALAAIALAAVAFAARPVAAQSTSYQASGAAPASAADARTQALDAAFATAVTEAVADLAGKAARTQAAAVEREITRRARRFVAGYRVTAERTAGDRLELEVAIKIDRDKLAAKLTELGVALRTAPIAEPGPPPVTLPSAAILLRVIEGDRVTASFGDRATAELPGRAALVAGLTRAGYRASDGAIAGPDPDGDGELPVDDASARALASAVAADAAVVASIAVGPPAPVRGAPIHAAGARGRLRVVDVASGRVVTELAIATAAWGEPTELTTRAATNAATALARQAWGERAPSPTPAAGPPLVAREGVTVRLVGAGAWQAAALVRADLLATPGVTAARWAGVTGEVVALAVDGATVERAAAVAKATPGFQARTRVEDGVVVVRVKSIDPPVAP